MRESEKTRNRRRLQHEAAAREKRGRLTSKPAGRVPRRGRSGGPGAAFGPEAALVAARRPPLHWKAKMAGEGRLAGASVNG